MCRDYAHAALTFESRLRFTAYVLAAGSSIGLLFMTASVSPCCAVHCCLDFSALPQACAKPETGGAAPAVSRRALCAFLGGLRRQTDDRRLAEAQSFCRSTYDEKDDMMQELSYMLKRMQHGGEDELPVLRDFAMRSGLADIADFVNVYEICRASGGDLARAMNRAATIIGG